MMDDFSIHYIKTGEATLFARVGGSGPPILLLHGFPETHIMWREIAPLLARTFTVVAADLHGYGQSSCPPTKADHSAYSKRSMGNDMVKLMRQLGFTRFAVVGHDRGARIAYRMALDHPEVIDHLGVCDIVPTGIAWEKADARMMLGFWPWSVLAQPSPLPEHIVATHARDIVDNACDQWGSSPDTFPPEIRRIYSVSLSDPERAHAVCEEYRAAAALDRRHDDRDLQEGRTIECPVLVLWGTEGAIDTWYEEEGGPLALWRVIAPQVTGEALSGGHFFPEENPGGMSEKLVTFLSSR